MNYKVAFETLGCRLNQAETASLHRSFIEKGCHIVEKSEEADLCVINTCALTSQAASKCRRKIRSVMTRNPDVCIAAVGCYAQTDTEVLREIQGVDYIIGTADKLRLAEIIPEPSKLPEAIVIRSRIPGGSFKIAHSGFYPTHTRANIKIQEGCGFVCSFCIIPKSRGPARSRDFDDILAEAGHLASEGHKEIIITGINVGTYRDGERGISSLVKNMSLLEGVERIRLSSIEPTTIDKDLFKLMNDGGSLCPYLHVPLQSGDDRILERMRRRYTVGEFKEFIGTYINTVPGAGLGTDIMVGFPGEDEKAFKRSCEIIEGLPLTHVHVFSFSARSGTGAYLMKDRVPEHVIKRRSEKMHEIAARKKFEYYQSLIGRALWVLFEERDSAGFWTGFSDNYVKAAVDYSDDLSNRMAHVKVTAVENRSASGCVLASGHITNFPGTDSLS